MRPRPVVRVVDDDPGICRMLSLALESWGYAVDVDGVRLHGSASGRPRPDVVLLDLRLGRTSAADYLAARRLARVPIVLMSASDLAPALRRELGAVAAIRKPFDLDDLLAILEGIAPVPREPTASITEPMGPPRSR